MNAPTTTGTDLSAGSATRFLHNTRHCKSTKGCTTNNDHFAATCLDAREHSAKCRILCDTRGYTPERNPLCVNIALSHLLVEAIWSSTCKSIKKMTGMNMNAFSKNVERNICTPAAWRSTIKALTKKNTMSSSTANKSKHPASRTFSRQSRTSSLMRNYHSRNSRQRSSSRRAFNKARILDWTHWKQMWLAESEEDREKANRARFSK